MKHRSALLSVAGDHPCLPGHFPEAAVVPGVLLLGLVHAEARQALAFHAGPTLWQRIKFVLPVMPEMPFRLVLDGDQDRFQFLIEDVAGATLARGSCRHDPLA